MFSVFNLEVKVKKSLLGKAKSNGSNMNNFDDFWGLPALELLGVGLLPLSSQGFNLPCLLHNDMHDVMINYSARPVSSLNDSTVGAVPSEDTGLRYNSYSPTLQRHQQSHCLPASC